MKEELPARYDIKEVEARIYDLWEKSGFFNPDVCVEKGVTKPDAEPFSIVLPPPNVTGELHMGHAAMLVIEDILARYNRMHGKRTLWLPGTDHAAMATQAKVENIIHKKEKKTRHDLGREEFLRRVNDYAKENHDTIIRQIKRMGSSLDWNREAYTLDERRNLAVRTAFKKMYDMGLIYRGNRIVNWDPELQTAVSDDEVAWTEETTPFYYLKYGPFVIGTARPETKFGDKYVVMHPDDERYKQYEHGGKIDLEWINGPVTATIVKDPVIDMSFGTGVMTITPWHDLTDFEIAERHHLDAEQIIDLHGKLLPIAGEFGGMHIKKARPLIIEKLKEKGLIEKIDEKYAHRIATNSRGNGIIEPQILKQWFVAANKKFELEYSDIKGIPSGTEITLKELMKKAVESGQIKILPERFEKTYYNWIDNLRDWCISRQLWFGHRIPVWYCGGQEKSTQPKMGFAGDVVPQVFDGKTKTYRLRNHGLKIGDRVLFENSQTKTLFGYGILTDVQKTTVNKIDYHDKTHYKTYNNLEELMDAFKLRNPDKTVTPESAAYLYAYEFHKFTADDSKDGCGNAVVSETAPEKCPACSGNNLVQDEDTLDTWFSSGLWPFSALGWPKETADMKTYFPNSVLETGYDILFFWVARMILMSTCLTGNVPFRRVYLHGLVRDENGRKMSKSLNNGIDPLEMADKFGADATRLSLVIGAAAGNDIKLSGNRIKGYRNFSTKIWNAARFVLMNKPESGVEINVTHRPEIKEFELFKSEVTKHVDEYEFHLAGEKLYHYFWHTLADKIIEQEKENLRGDDASKKAESYALLEYILVGSLKLLHPFVPFVTEEIWQKFYPASASATAGKPNRLLLVEKW